MFSVRLCFSLLVFDSCFESIPQTLAYVELGKLPSSNIPRRHRCIRVSPKTSQRTRLRRRRSLILAARPTRPRKRTLMNVDLLLIQLYRGFGILN